MTTNPDPSKVQSPVTTITTPRLTLRTMTVDDVDGFMPIITNPESMLMTTSGVLSGNHDEALEWMRARCLGVNTFKFTILLEGKVIGSVGTRRSPDCGYLIHPDYTGRGYATEALRAFMPAFFERYSDAEYIQERTDGENYGSQAVLRKCGLQLVKVEKACFENVKLGWRDNTVWRLEREEWAKGLR